MQIDNKIPTSYRNKAVIAEGINPMLPLRWEFLLRLNKKGQCSSSLS